MIDIVDQLLWGSKGVNVSLTTKIKVDDRKKGFGRNARDSIKEKKMKARDIYFSANVKFAYHEHRTENKNKRVLHTAIGSAMSKASCVVKDKE